LGFNSTNYDRNCGFAQGAKVSAATGVLAGNTLASVNFYFHFIFESSIEIKTEREIL
jgi:hypothetical protein